MAPCRQPAEPARVCALLSSVACQWDFRTSLLDYDEPVVWALVPDSRSSTDLFDEPVK